MCNERKVNKAFAAVLCECMPEHLNLNEAQSNRFGELKQHITRKISPAINSKMQIENELNQLWSAENPDRQAIESITERGAKIKAEIWQAKIDARFALIEMLDEKQKKRLRAMWLKIADEKPRKALDCCAYQPEPGGCGCGCGGHK